MIGRSRQINNFLNVDHDLRLAQPIGQPFVVASQLLILRCQRIGLRLRPALLRSQPFQDSGLAFLAPLGQMRRIQAMAPKHGADLAGPSGRIRFGQNLLFILARVSAPFRASQNLRIRAGRCAPALNVT